MIGDDFTLDSKEEDQWDAIVANEWPSDLESGTGSMRDADEDADTRAVDDEAPRSMVVHFPRRPTMHPLAMGAMLTGAAGWVAVNLLIPSYRLTAITGLPRRDRAEAVHQLTITAAITAVILLLAATCCSIWLVSFARYRLRHTSCKEATAGTPTITRLVRPPNPATATAWVLLPLIGSAIAWWWIVPRLDDVSATHSDAVAPLNEAVAAGLAWLTVVLLCTGGLTLWASREARHQLRRSAVSHLLRGRLHSNPEPTD